ncbi:hypothetical protein ABH930_004482 [Kitasatospora sp. GAS204A]|nr:hypothetical protein [Kitasatospora sp. GAS204B]
MSTPSPRSSLGGSTDGQQGATGVSVNLGAAWSEFKGSVADSVSKSWGWVKSHPLAASIGIATLGVAAAVAAPFSLAAAGAVVAVPAALAVLGVVGKGIYDASDPLMHAGGAGFRKLSNGVRRLFGGPERDLPATELKFGGTPVGTPRESREMSTHLRQSETFAQSPRETVEPGPNVTVTPGPVVEASSFTHPMAPSSTRASQSQSAPTTPRETHAGDSGPSAPRASTQPVASSNHQQDLSKRQRARTQHPPGGNRTQHPPGGNPQH